MVATIESVSTHKAPAAIGPYSQAIKANNFVFVSGQIPIDPKTGEIVAGNIKTQTKQVLENTKAILEASGCSLEDVVKTTVFMKNLNDFALINEAYQAYFMEKLPARSAVEVARLPRDVEIEIETVAIVES